MTRYCWVLTPTDSAIKVYCMTNTVTVSRTQWSVDKEQDTIQRHITHTPHATQGKLQSRQPQEMKTSARRRTPPLPATGKGVNDKFHRVSGRTGWRWDQQLRGMGRVQLSRTAAVFANSTCCIGTGGIFLRQLDRGPLVVGCQSASGWRRRLPEYYKLRKHKTVHIFTGENLAQWKHFFYGPLTFSIHRYSTQIKKMERAHGGQMCIMAQLCGIRCTQIFLSASRLDTDIADTISAHTRTLTAHTHAKHTPLVYK